MGSDLFLIQSTMNREPEVPKAASKKLASIEASFKSRFAYNHHLFELYLRYIRRRSVNYEICIQAQRLSDFMARQEIEPILSWEDALLLDRKNPLDLSPIQLRRQGKPFRKIAVMLQEVGVIEARKDNHDLRIQSYLDSFSLELKTLIAEYVDYQRGKNRSNTTIAIILIDLRYLHRWLGETLSSSHLLYASSENLRRYLSDLNKRYKPSHLYNSFYRLSHFYRWAVYRNYILINPIPVKSLASSPITHTIYSLEQIDLLLKFLKGYDHDPQIAMMLALVLLYAFTGEQLRTATVSWKDDQMSILSKAKEKSVKGRTARPEELILPKEPDWFWNLQKRFYQDWLTRRSKMNAAMDITPLLVHDNWIDSQAVGRSWVKYRLSRGTQIATGVAIPISVLRQTSAVIHKRGFDASILTKLGWSARSAMTYVWAPSVFFTPMK